MLDKKTASQCISSDYCRGWNDAVAATPRWISVEERLPEKHRVVLVHLRFGMIDTGVHNGFTWKNDLGIANNKNVTHWMPMPEPPEEDSTC